MRVDPAKVVAGAAAPTTRPIWLAQISLYDTGLPPIRVSSRESVVKNGNTFVSATVEIGKNELAIYNEGGARTDSFLRGRGTVYVVVWKSYGESPFVEADWVIHFQGEVGTREFSDWIVCELKPVKTRLEPHYIVSNAWCNHLIRRGTIMVTPALPAKEIPSPPPAPIPSPIYSIPTIPPWLQLPVVEAEVAATQKPVAMTLQNICAWGQPIPFLYGEFQIGGKPLVAHYNSTTDKWTVSYLVGLGPIDSIGSVWLNGIAPVAGVLVNKYRGDVEDGSQSVDPLLQAALAGYDDDNTFTYPGEGSILGPEVQGVAYVVVQWTNTHYSSPPDVVIEGIGRLGKTGAGVAEGYGTLSAPADFVRDFVTKAMRETCDDGSTFIAAQANEIVPPTGTNNSITRRSGSVIIDQLQPAENHLEVLRMYAGTWVFKRGNKWVQIADAAAPVSRTLTAADFVRGSFKAFLQDGAQVPTVINILWTRKPTAPEEIWFEETTQWLAPGVAEGIVERRESSVRMPGIHNEAEAQWEAQERGMKLALGLSFTGTVFDDNTVIERGDVIAVLHPRTGTTTYTYRITQADMTGRSNKPRMQITGVQYDPNAYVAPPFVSKIGNEGKRIIGEL